MSHASLKGPSRPTELLQTAALGLGALALLGGLGTRRTDLVGAGISLILLLPPLRLATSVFSEFRQGRHGVALMGAVVLALLLFSRRIS